MNIKILQAWFTRKTFIVAVLTAVALYLVMSQVTDNRLVALEQNVRVQIGEQQVTLVAIAEATSRNGADAVTESIIRDCTLQERGEFDSLLGKLNDGLSAAQLTLLERLFGRCGAFNSERKAVMVARLSREIELYKTFVEQLEVLEDEDLETVFAVSEWEALAAEETKQSELFSQLVKIQDDIITALVHGSSPTSPEIQEILQQAQSVQEALYVANQQASAVREGLIAL